MTTTDNAIRLGDTFLGPDGKWYFVDFAQDNCAVLRPITARDRSENVYIEFERMTEWPRGERNHRGRIVWRGEK